MIRIQFEENDPDATVNALVEVLRAAILNNATVAHDTHASCFVVSSLTRNGRSRTHRIGYSGEVMMSYGDLAGDEDLTRR